MDVAGSLPKVPCPWREIARNWRTSSMARAARYGIVLENVPTIDEVHSDILGRPKTCIYCSKPLSRRQQAGFAKVVMDHRVPVSRGGTAALDNLGLCCSACNGAKGPLLESEFRELLALISTWEDGGKALLIRLRGGFWKYTGGPGSGYRKGCVSHRKGCKLTPEHLENLTRANRVPRSPETIQLMRDAKLGSNNPWFGKDLSAVRAFRTVKIGPRLSEGSFISRTKRGKVLDSSDLTYEELSERLSSSS